ncbi:MAG: efflux RND transporter periplasmic adaptor subunit [Planctomycetota bacterium]
MPDHSSPPLESPLLETPPLERNRWQAFWDRSQFLVSLVLVGGALAWLLFAPHSHSESKSQGGAAKPMPMVDVVDRDSIRVLVDSPLQQRLERVSVRPEVTTSPMLQASGRVIASRRPAQDKSGSPFWQFSSGELLDSYTAWKKAQLEATFAETQLSQIKELAETRESGLQRTIDRLEKLVKSGTETERSLSETKTLLLQTRIEDRKSIFDGEVALKTVQRQANNEFLKLQQFGIDPDLLDDAPSDIDIVTAEVPEALVSLVAIGQQCSAEFNGLPNVKFQGNVSSLSPVLNAEQRTLRLLFVLKDPEDLLRPGMFARIGVGTDPRQVIRIPSDSILHIGNDDLIVVVNKSKGDSQWLDLEFHTIEVHEQINSIVEVRSGIRDGDTVIGKNAILLKPLIVRAMAKPSNATRLSHANDE